jgi:hypothetical protein
VKRLLASLLLAAACAGAHAEPAAPRAIWTWEEDSYAMLEQPASAGRAIGFLKSKSIDTVFLYADAFRGRNLIKEQPQLYRRLIRRLHASGMRAYALLGSGYLHTERYVLPKHRAEALAMLQRVLDYNKAAAPEERFDGINVDIEPHILAEWSTRKMELLREFVELSDALMDYRDRALGGDGIVSHAMDELAYAEKTGKQVLIGVETLPNAIKKVSFEHLKEADMERELGLTAKAVGAMKPFGGVVIHHYGQYRKWLGLD